MLNNLPRFLRESGVLFPAQSLTGFFPDRFW